MRTTIDAAGRVVVPKALRDLLGLSKGPVEVEVDGTGLRIRPVAHDELVEQDGFLVAAASGAPVTDSDVRALRDADQR